MPDKGKDFLIENSLIKNLYIQKTDVIEKLFPLMKISLRLNYLKINELLKINTFP